MSSGVELYAEEAVVNIPQDHLGQIPEIMRLCHLEQLWRRERSREIYGSKMEEKGWKGGDVAVITISLARQNGRDRTDGFKAAMAEVGSNVVGLLECKDYTREESMKLAQDLDHRSSEFTGTFLPNMMKQTWVRCLPLKPPANRMN